ncbi:DUF6443 domain-containing protein [Empedobacter brevis]|uniref:DUF6443 domain-containing protein n=1 Tax=Empedobacter brevis TaxID=247 RepID=UPI0023F00E76|nr:DUF6443 domain-containing protein [Empedobacter brevis]
MTHFYKKIMYSTLLTLGSSYTIYAQSDTENYIKTTECLKADCTEKKETVVYYDGLGREKQILQVGASPLGKTIVTPIEYDGFGRQAREYLPFPISNSSNQIDTISTGTTFYSTLTSDTTPFSEKTFESSPLNRILAQAAPGKSWATGSGHEIKFSYQANKSSDEVIIFEVKTTYNTTTKVYEIELTRRLSPVYYANGTLYKTVTTDENGQPIVEFKNKEGQVILKRIDTSDGRHDTYYVYDIYGNLTYVLPPKLLDLYYGSNPLRADWQKLMDELGYQYVYDEKNRLVEKQLPGKGREFMVYDNQDRLALQQDINQRTGNEKGWTFFKYDKYGRMVYSGFFKNSATRGSMQTALNNKRTPNNEERTSVGLGNNGTGLFYTNNQFPNGSLTVQSVHYYDHYQNLGVTPSSIDGQQVIGVNDTRTKGLAVASYTNVLGETTWNKAYTFYDEEYLRPVASHLVNYLNGYQTTASVLDFRGKVKNTVTKHMLAEYIGNEITVKEEFDYYPNELLKYQTHQVNNNPKEYIVQNSYNEINQLTSKKVGNTNSSTSLQKVDYKYNIRGWLTDINNIDVTETGTYKDLFSFRLNYDKVTRLTWEPQRFKPLYNGNINEAIWKASDNIIRSYNYQYDNLNRLREGTYIKGVNQIVNAYNEIIKGYDKNGNITGIVRSGEQDISNNMIWIDDTNYTYQANSNKLLAVTDNPGYKDVGFIDGNTSGNDYAYDANGNLIQDLNKGITKISYNFLNLPTEVLWGNGYKISYTYDASGVKLAKVVTEGEGVRVTTTDYINGFQYKQVDSPTSKQVKRLEFFPTTEGYVSVTGGTTFNYVYNYTDHLGNVRLSYQKESNGTLKVLEENNYYPFGLKHKGYNNTNVANPNYKYKYNGKELQDELGLNLYDYGARNYDPTIGRWFNIDPMAPKYFSHSPYTYTLNNPVYFIDPDGMQSIRNNGNGTVHSPETDQLDGVVAGVTVIGRSGGIDLSGLWFLQNSGRYNKYSFTNTAVRSYQNMMSTENGKTYYNNLHNSKLSKQMDNVALGYMALIALPVAVEYGTVYASSEAGGAMISKIIESKVGQYIGKVGLDLAIKGAFNGGEYQLNDITSSLVGGLIPGYASGAASEVTDLTTQLAMGKDVTMDNVAASTIKAFIIPPIGSVYGGISTHIFKSSGVTSSVVEGVHNQIAGDAVDNQIEQYRNYKNSQ